MLLAVDVGNTQTVLGLYAGDKLEHMWRMATNKTFTADELRIKVNALLAAERVLPDGVRGMVLASVVPRLTSSWVGVCEKLFTCQPLVVAAEMAMPLFKTSYSNPAEIGADRVADAVAAVDLYGAPAIVVDFGTATNIEVVDDQGIFVGGIIAPGVETSANALFSHAARLAAIELLEPPVAIGRTTQEAVQSGIVLGEAERVDGLVRRIHAELGYTTPVIATGGLAPVISQTSATITEVNQELTLVGLRLIYESVEKAGETAVGTAAETAGEKTTNQ